MKNTIKDQLLYIIKNEGRCSGLCYSNFCPLLGSCTGMAEENLQKGYKNPSIKDELALKLAYEKFIKMYSKEELMEYLL